MKNEKIGITPVDWALSIFGILVLVCLIVLPPVFRVAFKEKTKTVIDDQPKIEKMTCTKNNFAGKGFISNDTIEFTYISNQLTKYSRKIDLTFSDLTIYEQQKQDYGRAVTMYSFVSGATYNVTPDDGNLKIKVSETFDLGTFKPTSITIPGDTEETQVTSEYTRNDLVSDIKLDLTDSGYSCK